MSSFEKLFREVVSRDIERVFTEKPGDEIKDNLYEMLMRVHNLNGENEMLRKRVKYLEDQQKIYSMNIDRLLLKNRFNESVFRGFKRRIDDVYDSIEKHIVNSDLEASTSCRRLDNTTGGNLVTNECQDTRDVDEGVKPSSGRESLFAAVETSLKDAHSSNEDTESTDTVEKVSTGTVEKVSTGAVEKVQEEKTRAITEDMKNLVSLWFHESRLSAGSRYYISNTILLLETFQLVEMRGLKNVLCGVGIDFSIVQNYCKEKFKNSSNLYFIPFKSFIEWFKIKNNIQD